MNTRGLKVDVESREGLPEKNDLQGDPTRCWKNLPNSEYTTYK